MTAAQVGLLKATNVTDSTSDQLIDTLRDPACFGLDASESVELIETHISWVLLAGPYTYKIKKPVNFGFVDFSTLPRRRFFCAEELRLNGRLADWLYLDVVGISGSARAPLLRELNWTVSPYANGDGTEPFFEYAVKMLRFPQETLLGRRLSRGELTAAEIDSLTKQIADFHQHIPPCRPQADYGEPSRVHEPVRENFRHLALAAGDPQLQKAISELRAWSDLRFRTIEAQMRSRKLAGFVRECHGDMHLGNMFLWDAAPRGGVTIFDGIEFNPHLRWIDVISEIAFLVMDLEDRGRPDLSRRCLNGYLEQTGDYAGLELLAYYLVYRALVRAKVASLRFAQADTTDDEKRQAREQFAGYLELAKRYTQPTQPTLMLTHGFSGSGKTWGTTKLLEQLGAIRIRSDVERKRTAERMRPENAADDRSANLYTPEQIAAVYERLAQLAEGILQAGYSVIVDATFSRQQQRQLFFSLADRLQVPVRLLHFEASAETLRARIASRRAQGHDASDADLAVLDHQRQTVEPLSAEEHRYAVSINTQDDNWLNCLLDTLS